MELSEFKRSINDTHPPAHLSVCLKALWYMKKGNWDKAHSLVEHSSSNDAARVHAHLHRMEGDLWNADYWYKKARTQRPVYEIEEEWENLTALFLNN